MVTARQKVLAQLKKTRSASAREIARALKMSAPNVRHHLSVLRVDGLVEFVSVNNREGRGRPEKVFSLSQAALGDNLTSLVNVILDETGSKLNTDALAQRLLDSSMFANLPVSKRLGLFIEKLNEMHYQARWEAGAEGPRVIFGRCPYAGVLTGHPELCKMDEALVKNLLGHPVIRVKKADNSVRDLCPFVFIVG